jgi:hypothetical protein
MMSTRTCWDFHDGWLKGESDGDWTHKWEYCNCEQLEKKTLDVIVTYQEL